VVQRYFNLKNRTIYVFFHSKVPEQAFKMEVNQKRKIIIKIFFCVKLYLLQTAGCTSYLIWGQ